MTRAARGVAALVVTALALGSCGGPAPSSSGLSSSLVSFAPASPTAPQPSAVAASITEDGLRSELEALFSVSSGSTSWRALGSTGYDAAAELVRGRLGDAGWTVGEDRFTAPAFVDRGGSTLAVGDTTFGDAAVLPLIYAPGGVAEGPVVAIGWDPYDLGPGELGCAAADYGTLPKGAIVLVRSGPCYRRDAVLAAQAAGAAGFVAVTASPTPGVVLRSTLVSPSGLEIPAAGVSADAARAMADGAASGATARLETHADTREASTVSLVAELPGDTADQVVMLGAHLDSVIDGPGMNDNGSGVAALLEIAHALRGTRPHATIRLALWAGEEEGLMGSAHYVRGLNATANARVVAYLNADMIGSPNGFVGVTREATAPVGSSGAASTVAALLATAIRDLGGTSVDVDPGGGSDHVPFDQAGIATGGVFTGATEVLTAAQAATFGGTAGAVPDACYHQACDVVSNVRLPLVRLLAAALADVVVQLAERPALARG